MSNYKAVIYKPMWGKTLPELVAQAKSAVQELWAGIKDEPWSKDVEIDIAVAWLGNELVGDRGLFLLLTKLGGKSRTAHTKPPEIGRECARQ